MAGFTADDLVDTEEIAELLGLASAGAARVYTKRYDDFPAPVIEKGRCRLWLKADVRAWMRKRAGR